MSLVYLVEGALAIAAALAYALFPFLVGSTDSVLDFRVSTEGLGVSIVIGTAVSHVRIEREEDGEVLAVVL